MSSVRAFFYNAEGHDEEIDLKQRPRRLGKNQLLWVDGTLSDLQAVSAIPADMKTALAEPPCHRNLEIFDTFYRFVVPCLSTKSKTSQGGIVFVVGKSWLVTVSDPRPEFMDSFVETDRGESLNGRLTPSAFAVALVAALLDVYRTKVGDIHAKIDKLDDGILNSKEKHTLLPTLAKLRAQVATLRRDLDEMAIALHALTRPDFFAHIDAADHVHFEGLERTLERLQDAVATARETVIGSFELYTTRVAQDTNQLVKALTITTVITGIIGATAGIFGMNFDVPFFHSGAIGFSFVTGAMVASAVLFMLVAAWRRWF